MNQSSEGRVNGRESIFDVTHNFRDVFSQVVLAIFAQNVKFIQLFYQTCPSSWSKTYRFILGISECTLPVVDGYLLSVIVPFRTANKRQTSGPVVLLAVTVVRGSPVVT